MLSWDSVTENSSDDNQFTNNYFTHRLSNTTSNAIRVSNYVAGNDNSLNARNRFIGCAFEETVSGNLTRVISDEGTWWMTSASHPDEYSVRLRTATLSVLIDLRHLVSL